MKGCQYLHVIGLSDVNQHFLNEMTYVIGDHKVPILSGQINTIDKSQSFDYLMSGAWHVLAKLEIKLKALAKKHTVNLVTQRTLFPAVKKSMLCYILSIVTVENPYALYYVMRFLSQSSERVVMTKISVDSYKTRQTQTAMTLLTVHIQLSTDTAIADWREAFMLFCDDLNFDAVMEPDKN